MAPEVLRGERIRENNAAALDVYSFGVLLWEIWARARPWDEITEKEARFTSRLCELVNAGVRPQLPERAGEAPDGYDDVMRLCWATVPDERPTFAAAVAALDKVQAGLSDVSQSTL